MPQLHVITDRCGCRTARIFSESTQNHNPSYKGTHVHAIMSVVAVQSPRPTGSNAADSPSDLLLLAICHVRRNGSAALLSRTCVMDSMSPNRSHHATSHCPTAGPCKLRNGSTCYPHYSPAVAATAAAAAPAKACSCCVYLACCNAEHIQGSTAAIYLLLDAAALCQPLRSPRAAPIQKLPLPAPPVRS